MFFTKVMIDCRFQVHLQTQQVASMGGSQMAVHIVRSQGLLALYNGLSASLLRQITYSTTRFAIYEVRFVFNLCHCH